MQQPSWDMPLARTVHVPTLEANLQWLLSVCSSGSIVANITYRDAILIIRLMFRLLRLPVGCK